MNTAATPVPLRRRRRGPRRARRAPRRSGRTRRTASRAPGGRSCTGSARATAPDPRCAARRVPRIEPAGRSLTCVTPSPCHGSPRNRVSLRHGRPLASASCCGSYCPRVRSRRRRSSCSRPPTCTSCALGVDYWATIDDPRDRRGAHPAPAGDPGVRRRGLVRHRHHRSRLGGGDRRATSSRLGELRYSKATRTRSAWSWRSPATRRSPTVRARRRRAGVVGVPRAHPALLRRPRRRRRRAPSATARARPRSPTSPTASSRSPRPGGPCVRPGSR